MDGPSRRNPWFVVLVSLLVAAVVAAIWFATQADLAGTRPGAVVVLGALAAVAAISLVRWRYDLLANAGAAEAEAARAREAEAQLSQTEQDLQRERGEREQLQQRLDETEQRLRSEEAEKQRLASSRDTYRRWTRELRTKIQEFQSKSGPLGRGDDIPSMVLEIAARLLDAKKGMILQGENGNSDLKVIAHRGFDHDPADSKLARRFAGEVLDRDTIIRENDEGDLDEAKRSSADEEIHNLVAIPMFVADEFSGVVVCANSEDGFDEHEEDVLLALGDHAGAVLQNASLHGELRTSYLATVQMLADAIEAKDALLRGHSEEVLGYVGAVADRLEVNERTKEELLFGSLLHDVGKIGISERILLKPGRLTPEEFNVIKLHSRIGFRLIDTVPALRPIARAILHHHERWDGQGYPSGLTRDEIPIESRVIAVADSFAAMTADRPYRGRMSLDQACEELERCAGTQFDPNVVKIFIDEIRKHPPEERDNALQVAMTDPEIDVRRTPEEPVLGHSSMSVTDNLTLLYSHTYFHEIAQAEAERAAVQNVGFFVLLLELQNIDEINRSDGYRAGDQGLRRCGAALGRAAVRAGGTACRYSGRSFGLISANPSLELAETIASELERELSNGLAVTTSVTLWQPGDSADDVIARARAGLTRRMTTSIDGDAAI